MNTKYKPPFINVHRPLVILGVLLVLALTTGLFWNYCDTHKGNTSNFVLIPAIIFHTFCMLKLLNLPLVPSYISAKQYKRKLNREIQSMHKNAPVNRELFCAMNLTKNYIIDQEIVLTIAHPMQINWICHRYPEEYFTDNIIMKCMEQEASWKQLENRFPKFKDHPIRLLQDF